MAARNGGQHRLRRGRVSIPYQAYILTTVTAERRPIFTTLQAARIVVNGLRYQHDSGRIRSLAYVLMPDHLHWLVALGPDCGLSPVMRSLKSFTARRIKGHFPAWFDGSIWQTGFHDRALRREEDLLKAARYLVANPLRAGLAEEIGDYPHWDAIWLGEERQGWVLD